MRIRPGVKDTQLVMCPACLGNNCQAGGTTSDGRTLTIHFSCQCGAEFEYVYVRQGGETLFMIKLVEVNYPPVG